MASGFKSTVVARPHPALANIPKDLIRSGLNWEDLLKAGPQVLGILAKCVIAANSSSKAFIVPLNIGVGKLKYATLQANLQDMIDVGQDAFIESDRTMLRLMKTAEWVCRDQGLVSKVLLACDPAVSDFALHPALQKLLKATEGCVADSSALHKRYADWKTLAADVRKACQETDGDVQKKASDVVKKSRTQEGKKEESEERIKQLDSKIAEMEKSVKELKTRVQEAEAKVPTGWKMVGQETFEDLASSTVEKYKSINIKLNSFYVSIKGVETGVKFEVKPDAPSPTVPMGDTESALNLAKSIIRQLKDLQNIYFPQAQFSCFNGEPYSSSASPTITQINLSLGELQATDGEGKEFMDLDKLLRDVKMLGESTASAADADRQPSNPSATQTPNYNIEGTTGPQRPRIQMPGSFGDDDDDEEDGFVPVVEVPTSHGVQRVSGRNKKEFEKLCIHAEDVRSRLSKKNKKEIAALKRQKDEEKRAATMYLRQVQQARDVLYKEEQALAAANLESGELRFEQNKEQREYKSLVIELEELQSDSDNLHIMKKFLQKCCEDLNQVHDYVVRLEKFFSGVRSEIEHICTQNIEDFIDSGHGLLEADSDAKRDYYYQAVQDGAVDVYKHFTSIGEIARIYHDISEKHIMTGLEMINKLNVAGDSVSKQESINTVKAKFKDAYDDISDMVIYQHNATVQKRKPDVDVEIVEVGEVELLSEASSLVVR